MDPNLYYWREFEERQRAARQRRNLLIFLGALIVLALGIWVGALLHAFTARAFAAPARAHVPTHVILHSLPLLYFQACVRPSGAAASHGQQPQQPPVVAAWSTRHAAVRGSLEDEGLPDAALWLLNRASATSSSSIKYGDEAHEQVPSRWGAVLHKKLRSAERASLSSDAAALLAAHKPPLPKSRKKAAAAAEAAAAAAAEAATAAARLCLV